LPPSSLIPGAPTGIERMTRSSPTLVSDIMADENVMNRDMCLS